LLHGRLAVTQFVNADEIARGLAGFAPETAALPAGRIMLARLKELERSRANFAFETTLASRSFAPWLRALVAGGYQFHLVFLWLPSPAWPTACDLGDTTCRRRQFAGAFGRASPISTVSTGQ